MCTSNAASAAPLAPAFNNHGSIVLVQPHTEHATAWIAEHVGVDAQWFGRVLVVEPRYIDALVCGMRRDGFEVGA
jgi:hypothetical protein